MFISREKFEERINAKDNLLNIGVVKDEEVKDISAQVEDSIPAITPEVVEKTEDLTELAFGNILNGSLTINTKERRDMGIQGMVKGDTHIPQVIRDIITVQSHFDTGANIARTFGVSPAQVSAYKHGAPNKHSESEANIRAKSLINSSVVSIRKKVEDRILHTLEFMTNEKLVDLDAKGLSQIARNLSGVLPGVEKTDSGNKVVNVQTIFYNPGQKSISEYEVVEEAS